MRTGMVRAQAGTFTIARGRDEGYRVLTAPEFLVASRRTGVLSDLASADRPDGEIVHAGSAPAGGQPVYVSYTSRPVTTGDLDEPGLRRLGSPPLDAFGRPLRIVYGIAYQARTAGVVPPSQLDLAEGAAIEAFRAFIADESGYRLQVSPPVAGPVLDADTGGKAYGEQASGPVPGAGRSGAVRRGPVLALAGTALAAAVAVVLVVTSSGSAGRHPGNPQGSAPASSAPSPSSAPGKFLPAERMLYDRLLGHVQECAPVRGSGRIGNADATLHCSIADQRPDSPVTVASFTTVKALGGFLAGEERKEKAEARREKKPFATSGTWKGADGSAGRVIAYRDGGKKAWVVWSFQSGSFTDAHRKYLVVKASGSDADALYEWWRTHPV